MEWLNDLIVKNVVFLKLMIRWGIKDGMGGNANQLVRIMVFQIKEDYPRYLASYLLFQRILFFPSQTNQEIVSFNIYSIEMNC